MSESLENPAESAKEHAKLQEEFIERSGVPYWQDKAKRETGEAGVESKGYEKRVLGKIREKLERIDEVLLAVDWTKKESRQSFEQSAESLATKEKESEAFKQTSAILDELEKEEENLGREQFDLIRSRRGIMTEIDREAAEEIAEAKREIQKKKKQIAGNPETIVFARMRELLKYQEGLKVGFAETPSRKVVEEWVEEKWRDGKATLLEGPTGTGKTELLNHLTRKLYGQNPEIVRSTERTGPSEIFGRVLLKANEAGGTETYFQPGRVLSAMDKGLPVVFDEFNQLQTNTRFQLKELYNRRAGDEVVIQEDTGRAHRIKEGFVFAATANLKSEKYKERFELDGAESRVFSMKRVEYMPKEELYDVLLASLMGKDGQAPISRSEANITLKNFTDAVEEIQNAYDKTLGNHYGLTDAKGTKPKLEKAILDPGAALAILRGFEASRAEGFSLQAHLEKGLMDFLGKRDYPDKDRNLMARILVAKGFFKDTEAKDFNISGLDDKALAALRPKEEKEKVIKTKARGAKDTLALKDLATLDPYGLRAEEWRKLGLKFLAGAPKPPEGGKRFKEMPNEISAEFTGVDGKKETIEINFEESYKRWADLFAERKVGLPPDFELTARAIWNQNYDKIKESMENLGYDGALMIPGNLNLPDFHKKMTKGYKPSWESENFKEGGSWAGVKSSRADKPRIILYHDKSMKELGDNPITKEMLGKNLMVVTGLSEEALEKAIIANEPITGKVEVGGKEISFDGLSVEDYLAIQAEYFKRTNRHLDEKSYTWLMGSISGRRVPVLHWRPVGGRLGALAGGPGIRDGDLAPRPAAVFNLVSEIRPSSEFSFEISGEFENLAGEKEKIEIDFEKEMKSWQKFYENYKIEPPPDFSEQVADVLGRNRVEMEQSIEEMGYDKAIIVPSGLDAKDLHRVMIEGYKETYEYDSFKNAGSFKSITTPNADKLRIILVHEKDAQNNDQHPILRELRGKSVEDLASLAGIPKEKAQELLDAGEEIPMKVEIKGRVFTFKGLDVLGYLVWQREHFDRTKNHIDEAGWSSLPGSSMGKGKTGRRVPELTWRPVGGQLIAIAFEPGDPNDLLAPRPAAVFA